MKKSFVIALREWLHYDPTDGTFTHLKGHGRRKAGDPAGIVDSNGYLIISFGGRPYKAHRLAWIYIHGREPVCHLDHINLVKLDNRIANLREANSTQNKANIGRQRNNKSGFKGVFWYAKVRKWRATIGLDRRRIHLGDFETPEAAHAAYCKAATELYGEFARVA